MALFPAVETEPSPSKYTRIKSIQYFLFKFFGNLKLKVLFGIILYRAKSFLICCEVKVSSETEKPLEVI